ncbi:hypothetical protein FACS1894190_15910 [Spirochaetia bacterium]|nr:hypothetical protein FACS1894190_15910 [Spirochaetia bacterium]
MKKKGFFLGMMAMALSFGLVMVGCDDGLKEQPRSIAISGTAKVGETLTANSNNIIGGIEWYLYDDAACTKNATWPYSAGQGYTGISVLSGSTIVIPAANGQISAVGKYIRASSSEVRSNVLGPVAAAGSVETSVIISPKTETAAKGGTKSFTVTINETVTNSGNIVWTVEGSTPSGTSTINGSRHSINGSTTTQTRELNVGAGETATTLTVKVTYNGKSDTAAVTVVSP